MREHQRLFLFIATKEQYIPENLSQVLISILIKSKALSKVLLAATLIAKILI